MNDYDYLIKLIIIGDSGVGKTAILQRYTELIFKHEYITTIGVDFRLVTLQTEQGIVRLQIWDTAGQEKFNSITSSYYKGAHAIMLVFDLANPNSFGRICFWISEVKTRMSDGNYCFVLVGNKIDTMDDAVDSNVISEFVSKYNIIYYETSAKTGDGIENVFQKIATNTIDMMITGLIPYEQRRNITGCELEKSNSNKNIVNDKCCAWVYY